MSDSRLRIIFASSAPIALPFFSSLTKVGNVVALLTAVDRVSGRGLTLKESTIKLKAKELKIANILQPDKLDSSVREAIKLLKPDILVVFAYGKIFGPKFLSLFPKGGINLHPSLLPKYRGPAPISSAILNRDDSFGISLQKISLSVDEGDILISESYKLNLDETTDSLTQFVSLVSAKLIEQSWHDINNLLVSAQPQLTKGVSHTTLILKEDGEINWNKSADEIESMVRAYQPWPKAWSFFNGKKLFIFKSSFTLDVPTDFKPGTVLDFDSEKGLKVQCNKGFLFIEELQLQSKKRMDWKVFYNGNKSIIDSQLGGIK